MKILIVTDKENSAIDRLAQYVKRYSRDSIEILPIHPKRESEANLQKFKTMAETADLIDFEYWKTATMLLKKFPELKNKPSILTHHNPYNVTEEDWNQYKFDHIVAKNLTQYKELKDAGYKEISYIRHAVDFNKYDYYEGRDFDSKDVLMVAARIEGKKGIKEVAQACYELGYKFHLVGSISDANYFNELLPYEVRYHEKISDEELADLYNKCALHVCNSRDNFESGTMPILESMASGLPVLSRNVGLVPDISNGKNLVIRFGKPDDIDELKREIKGIVENKERKEQLSIEGYRSAIYYSGKLMAREYSKLFRKVMYGNSKTVSVIIPTLKDREENLLKITKAYNNQTYKNIELVIVEDNEKGYNLAKSRNIGATLAIGDILIFNDDRFVPKKDIVEKFVSKLRPKTWLYGNKDNAKKMSFVENFSCVYRREFIDGGMCSERINEYGGMSQELRERFGRQGVYFEYCDDVRAKSLHRSKSRMGRLKSIRKMKTLLEYMYGG